MKFGEFKYKRSEVRDSYQSRRAVSVSSGCICYYTRISLSLSIGIMSYCGSLSALAAGAARIGRVCLQFHALRFSRSNFHAAPQEKWESGNVDSGEVWGKFCYCLCILTHSLPDNLVLATMENPSVFQMEWVLGNVSSMSASEWFNKGSIQLLFVSYSLTWGTHS